MTALSERMRELDKARTPGPWRRIAFDVRYGPEGGNKRIATTHLAYKSSAETCANATVIALSEYLPRLVIALVNLIIEVETGMHIHPDTVREAAEVLSELSARVEE